MLYEVNKLSKLISFLMLWLCKLGHITLRLRYHGLKFLRCQNVLPYDVSKCVALRCVKIPQGVLEKLCECV